MPPGAWLRVDKLSVNIPNIQAIIPRPGHSLIVQTQFQQIDFHRRVSAALSSVPPGSAGIRSWDNFVQLPQLQLVNC